MRDVLLQKDLATLFLVMRKEAPETQHETQLRDWFTTLARDVTARTYLTISALLHSACVSHCVRSI